MNEKNPHSLVAEDKKEVKENKLSFYQVTLNIIYSINRSHLSHKDFPAFPHEWVPVTLASGIQAIYEKNEAGLKQVSESYCAQEILCFADSLQTKLRAPEYQLNPTKAKTIAEHWLAVTPRQTPKFFAFKDEPEALSYVRLPWSVLGREEEPTPHFDELFSRMTNAQVFKEWIGSIFFEESDIQQFIWLHGTGGDGKSALLRALKNVVSNLYVSKREKGKGSPAPHWEHSLVGKRLVAFPDTNSASFILSGTFKSLTGGDNIEINPKGKDCFSYDLKAKFLILSNVKPNVGFDKSDKRRIIYVTVSPIRDSVTFQDMAVYEDKLAAEAKYFFKKCCDEFLANREHVGVKFDPDMKELDEIVIDNNEIFEDWLNWDFILNEYQTMPPYALYDYVRSKGVRNVDETYKKFREYLLKVKKVVIKKPHRGMRTFCGVSRKINDSTPEIRPSAHLTVIPRNNEP